MDDNQNLKPELKAIYERIMKTTPSQSTKTQNQETQQTQSSPPPQTPPSPEKPLGESSHIPQAPQTQTPFAESTEIPTSYSSVSPRPLRDTDSSAYMYSANKNISGEIPLKSPPPPPITQTKTEDMIIPVNEMKKAGGHGIITFISVFLFFVVYIIFWLIFFGVINTSTLGLPSISLPFSLPFSQ